MELDRDPTDQGVARTMTVSELDEVRAQAARARVAARLREAGLSPRRLSGVVIPAQRSGRSLRLLVPCPGCGSPPSRWCRVRGREVVGHLHEARQALGDTPTLP